MGREFEVGDLVRFRDNLPPLRAPKHAVWVITEHVVSGGYTRARVRELVTGFTAVRGFHRLEKINEIDL